MVRRVFDPSRSPSSSDAQLGPSSRSPIPPGSTFTYEIPTDLQEGTYWIHGKLVRFICVISTHKLKATRPEELSFR